MKIKDGILEGFTGLRVAIIPKGRKRRPQISMNATTITIHNTGCPNVPADNFKRSCHDITQDQEVSYHFVVDEKEVIQLLPINEVGWHAGNRQGNYSSIGIEICERAGAEGHAIKFIAELLKALSMNADNLRTHKSWSGKQCPRLILPHWSEFVNHVRNVHENVDNVDKTTKINIMLNGVMKEVETVNIDGHNFVKLRDLADNKIEVLWDKATSVPVVNVVK